jgi:hypothetical protein
MPGLFDKPQAAQAAFLEAVEELHRATMKVLEAWPNETRNGLQVDPWWLEEGRGRLSRRVALI